MFFDEIYTYFGKELPNIIKRLPLSKAGRRFAIYGMGTHTERLLKQYTMYVGEIKADLIFVDSKKVSLSQKYNGCDVYNIHDIWGLELDGIIISSSLYEDIMYNTIESLYGNKFRIYRFYEENKQDIFIKDGIYFDKRVCDMPLLRINFADFWPGFNRNTFFMCRLLFDSYRLELSNTPDILFCSQFGEEHKKYSNCKKILYVTEPRPIDWNEYDYAIGYPKRKDGRFMHFNSYIPRKYELYDRSKPKDVLLAKRKFCNFIYSNDSYGDGALLRKMFCQELNKYKSIDCPGRVLNNMKNAIGARYGINWRNDKLEFISNYKFTIAFENSMIDGYTTEKLWDAFRAGSIPIYWGNPAIGEIVCKDAFVNCNDYDNDFKTIIEKIKEIDNDDDLYMHMLRKSPFKSDYKHISDDEIRNFLISVCLGQ